MIANTVLVHLLVHANLPRMIRRPSVPPGSALLIGLCLIGSLVSGRTVAAAPEATTEAVPRANLRVVLHNARAFVRAQQDERGRFGLVQPHLQTGVAMLALLSLSGPGAGEDLDRLSRAASYLAEAGGRSGDLGDSDFGVESHAIATTALLCALPHLTDDELKTKVSRVLHRALQSTRRLQDRSRASASRGGWKMEGREGRENDRRASTWAILSLHAAQCYGIAVADPDIARGAGFVLGSFKEAADTPDQVGGLSVDTEGLSVASISAMGGWLLARVAPDPARAAANLDWLRRHPAAWSGPNYFYTEFFRLRVLLFADAAESDQARALRRTYVQIRDHQHPDGSVGFPPGNAQNTVAMGSVFSTSMAILALNVEDSRLVFDEDCRVTPPF